MRFPKKVLQLKKVNFLTFFLKFVKPLNVRVFLLIKKKKNVYKNASTKRQVKTCTDYFLKTKPQMQILKIV